MTRRRQKWRPVSPYPLVSTEIRVRYAETDAMGIAHHTAYLVWFEAGRTEYTRTMGMAYREVERGGTRLVVVEDAGHHVALEQPETLGRLVLSFLAERA